MEKDMKLSLIHAPDRSGDDAHDIADIVFVHGLGGHPYRTWAAPKFSTFWPQSLLPKDLPGLRILTFGYQAQATHFTTKIVSQKAEGLLNELVERRSSDLKTGRDIIFLAHGLGGIIVKQALVIASNSSQSTHRNILDSTLGTVFFSTPHSTRAEDIKRVLQYAIFAGGTRVKSDVPDLLRQSVVSLQAIQQTFEELHLRKLRNIQIASFYEELPIADFGLVVDESLDVAQKFTLLPLHSNHETICKFASSTQPNYQRVLGELKKILSRSIQNQRALDREEQGFLRWLQIDNGSDTAKSALDGTCNWVFEHREFGLWLKQDPLPFLWLYGKPGSGKSTLVKHIIKELEYRSFGSSNTITISYFFHHTDITHSSTRGLFQSLLFQLLSQIPNAMSDFIPLFQQKWELYSKLSGSSRNREQWQAKDLEDLWDRAVTKISNTHTLFIIIDALDECLEEEEAVRLLSLLSSIHSKTSNNAVRFCVSTRPCAYLEPFNCTRHRKIILQDENCKDIQHFTQLKLERQLRPSIDKSYILELIVEKASGMFLWVSLTLDLLAHDNCPGEVSEKTLWAIPSDLDALYRTIYDRFIQNEQESHGLARKILTWVCFALRPLSIEELQEALELDSTPYFGTDAVSTPLVTNGHFSVSKLDKTWSITQYCWGFIEAREYQKPGSIAGCRIDGQKSYLLHLVHGSARDFLRNTNSMEIGSKITSKHGLSEYANMYLANVCLQYLSFHAEASSIDAVIVIQDSEYLFLQYAAMNWLKHAKLADCPSSSHLSLLKNLRWPSTKVISHWMQLYQKNPRNNAISNGQGWTVLHAAAAFGLYNLALAMHKIDKSAFVTWDIGDATGRTPLSWAAENGHSSVVRLLLKGEASINTRDTYYGLSPLHWAALQGHQAVAKILIEGGAAVDDQVSGSTPLSIAVARGHGTVVRVLLEVGSNPNLIDRHYGQAPLHLSATHGNPIVVSYLLAHGADPNILDQFSKRTPLYYAAVRSFPEIVRLLIDHGATIPCSADETLTESLNTWADRVIYALSRSLGNLPSSCPRNSGSASESNTIPPGGSSHATNGEAKESQNASHKRRREDRDSTEGNGNGGFGDDPNKHPALGPTPLSSTGRSRLRLACPYFKYDPERYSAQRTCRGPDGWPDVHRLKQHLYERHFIRVCRRCRQIFQSEQDLSEHATAERACLVQQRRNYADGFDEDQKALLKSRIKKKENLDQLGYWKDVYRILFPEAETTHIPSPFYENESMNYISYDESCAHTRLHDPLLRGQLLQMVHDSRLVDGILNLINNHQSAVIRPTVLQSDGSSSTRPGSESTLQSQPLQGNELTAVPNYQPINLGNDELSYDEYSFFLMMREPPFLRQQSSVLDSGFYSGSSAITQLESNSRSLQSADGGYASDYFTSQNPREVQGAPEPATAMMDHESDFQIPPLDQEDVPGDAGLDSELWFTNMDK